MKIINLEETIKQNLLEDYVGLWEISREAEKIMKHSEVKDAVLIVIHNLIKSNFMKAGFPLEDGSFSPWKMSVEDIINRIDEEWGEQELSIGDVVWFSC